MAAKTAKEIALEVCSAEVQSKISEVAALSDVPDDDPLWLVFLAGSKTNALLDKISGLEEGMSILTEAFLENDTTIKELKLQMQHSTQENQTHSQAQQQTRSTNLRRLLVLSVSGMVGLALVAAIEAIVIMGYQSSAWEVKQKVKQTEVVDQRQNPSEAIEQLEQIVPLKLLKSSLSKANQDRLEACLQSQNSKCTLLIEDFNQTDEDPFVDGDLDSFDDGFDELE